MVEPSAWKQKTTGSKSRSTWIFDLRIGMTNNPFGLARKDRHRWGILLGMFIGAPQNEICQLDIADVQQDGNVWFMNITDEGNDNKREARRTAHGIPRQSMRLSERIKRGVLVHDATGQWHMGSAPKGARSRLAAPDVWHNLRAVTWSARGP